MEKGKKNYSYGKYFGLYLCKLNCMEVAISFFQISARYYTNEKDYI